MADAPQVGHGCRSAEVIEVIRTVATRGNGETTVFRTVTSYWSKDGVLLAEVDPCPDEEVLPRG